MRAVINSQEKIFRSREFYKIELPVGWRAVGFTKYSAEWLFNLPWVRSGMERRFLFVASNESDVRLLTLQSKVTREIVEDNKWIGSMFVMGPKDDFGIYYETIEGIGFFAVSEKLTQFFEAHAASIKAMQGYFDAELVAVEKLQHGRGRDYARKMRALTDYSASQKY